MSPEEFFPFWSELSPRWKERLYRAAVFRRIDKGTIVHNGSTDCLGLLLVNSGQLRAYIISPEGREITIYRLFARDICLFSASCMMQNIQFDITIEAEKDATVWIIPPKIYKKLMDECAAAANYTNGIMASRFSEVMWLMEQVLWNRFDRRLAAFLLEESVLEDSSLLTITHEKIANHMGSAREVVTRMLRYFQKEGLVELSRGTIRIVDSAGLEKL